MPDRSPIFSLLQLILVMGLILGTVVSMTWILYPQMIQDDNERDVLEEEDFSSGDIEASPSDDPDEADRSPFADARDREDASNGQSAIDESEPDSGGESAAPGNETNGDQHPHDSDRGPPHGEGDPPGLEDDDERGPPDDAGPPDDVPPGQS